MGMLQGLNDLSATIMALFLFQFNQPISLSHIGGLYYGSKSGKEAPGLSFVPKLYEHLHLTSFSKIRVDLAAQV